MFRRLKHYGVYLDPDHPEDAEMIQRLEPYRRTKRVGELIRQALRAYFGGGVQAAPMPPPAPVQHKPIEQPRQASTQMGDAEQAKARVRNSFLK